MSKSEKKLIFVYNADSGILSAIKDGIHKTVSPSTYQCRLCALTFGAYSMKPRWKRFVEKLDIPVIFLHRDQFQREYHLRDAKFPSAYISNMKSINLFIPQREMNSLKSLDELMDIVKERLRETNLR